MDSTKLWSLKDKAGNEPIDADRNCIEKLSRDHLFPCPRTIEELKMPTKSTAPREMNSFIVFRRQLAHVAKLANLSDDGKNLSRFASYIWHGASLDEKEGYARIARVLKQKHKETYPDYTYERRKRKTFDGDFILTTPDSLIKKKKSKRKAKKTLPVLPVSTESSPPAQEQEQHESISPKSIELGEPQDYIAQSSDMILNPCIGIDFDYLTPITPMIPQESPRNEWYPDFNNGDQSAGFYFFPSLYYDYQNLDWFKKPYDG
ncbi:9056_t:CDS:1 [Funneliformis geosporum]|uniref:10277_t:CDS:1 n=1 Tax=Funneliformis geosporum TaxID=1117311 RepID=A0A9W4WP24_9GLOM|nr:10277_t:CDS:1 [Funneliformis geosporum]CAI2161504.1 9056_t:CDS:1 [Funneliformis geosporum]